MYLLFHTHALHPCLVPRKNLEGCIGSELMSAVAVTFRALLSPASFAVCAVKHVCTAGATDPGNLKGCRSYSHSCQHCAGKTGTHTVEHWDRTDMEVVGGEVHEATNIVSRDCRWAFRRHRAHLPRRNRQGLAHRASRNPRSARKQQKKRLMRLSEARLPGPRGPGTPTYDPKVVDYMGRASDRRLRACDAKTGKQDQLNMGFPSLPQPPPPPLNPRILCEEILVHLALFCAVLRCFRLRGAGDFWQTLQP